MEKYSIFNNGTRVKKSDYNNELRVEFVKHSRILLSNILKKENNTYFNIKFEVNDAIIKIKSKLLAKLPIEKDIDNELIIYKEIEDLIKICNKYLEKIKSLPKSETSNYINKIQESNKIYLDLSEENKIVHKNNRLKDEKNGNASNCNNNAPKNSDEKNIIVNQPKNNFIKSGSKIVSINFQSGDQVNSCTNNNQKKKKKNLSKGEIDILITNVNKNEFLKLKNNNYLKYYFSNNTAKLPENFNIIIEACLSLSNQMEEKNFK